MSTDVEVCRIAQVESFLEAREGKKNPSKKDAGEFENLWLAAADESGLCDGLLTLLSRGFRFAAARPVFKYLKSADSSERPYELLGLSVSALGESGDFKLRLFMSLFALELSDPTSIDCIADLALGISKEAAAGNGVRNLPKHVHRLMLPELAGKTIGVNATVLGSALRADSGFAELLGPAVMEVRGNAKLKAAEKEAAKVLQAWLEALYASKGEAVLTEAVVPDESAEVADCSADEPVQVCDAVLPDVDQIVSAVKGLGAVIGARDEKIASLSAELASSKSEAAKLRDLEKSLNDRNAELQSEVAGLNESVAGLRDENEALQRRISELSVGLEASRKMVELLESAGSKQNNEAMKRVSRKLKIEFDDYRDALDIEMDVDLGENMRLQLGSVFQILKENGFEL